MKKLILGLAVITVIFATVGLIQSRRLASQREELTALSLDAEQRSNQLAAVQAAEQRAKEEAEELRAKNEALARETQPPPKPSKSPSAEPASPERTNPEPDKPTDAKGGFGKMLSSLMQDPATKKLIRDQQRMMMNQLYAPLVKRMALTPDEAEKFKDLLADNMMKGAESATDLFGGSSSNRTDVTAKLAASQAEFDEQIKAFLGDSRYDVYKDYQATLSERMQLNQYKLMTGSETPFTDDQTEQLLAIMKEERQNVTTATAQEFPAVAQDKMAFASMSDEQIEKLLQSQDTVNQRVYDRANQVLTPEQLQQFGKFQTNQLQMMRTGMAMMRKMFDGNLPDGPGAAPTAAK